jgi:oligoribonuclease
MEARKTNTYIWLDTEFSGLDLDHACLLQVAALITDADLKRVLPPGQDPVFYVKLENEHDLSPWVREHLPDLIARCRSSEALGVAEIDVRLTEWVTAALGGALGIKQERPILAGNSIHADWFLVRKFLPRFAACLHYRLLDVTTLKLLWQDSGLGEAFDKDNPALVQHYSPMGAADLKGKLHDAAYDIHASIAELNFYRQKLLVPFS